MYLRAPILLTMDANEQLYDLAGKQILIEDTEQQYKFTNDQAERIVAQNTLYRSLAASVLSYFSSRRREL